jgi:predicted  nucleic acid-binding Zn-ribbon protein
MYLDKLNAMKKSTNTKTKTLADAVHRSERTVGRMLAGEAGIDMSELQTMVSVMGGTLDDIFDGSDMRLPRPEVETLKKQIEALTEEIGILKAENAMLRDKNTALDTENDKLRLTLAHKEELLALHSYYMGLKKGD